MSAVDPAFWRGRRVLLTGHTGFKGAWLALWLQTLGARVWGFAAGVPTRPSLYELARVAEGLEESIAGDVRDHAALSDALARSRPEVVLHMAAQSLVRRSYLSPRETYEVNVIGTVNLLDAVRLHDGREGHDGRVAAVLVVTSDKCYQNREWPWAYRESEPMGGHDPYSSSKGCAELVTAAYRDSFFSAADSARVASGRAGNVIGGGDWGQDRLVADVMRAALAGETVTLRNPASVRPWQHVLNPLHGYLSLVQALARDRALARGWNFGPAEDDARSVRELVARIAALWPEGLRWVESESSPEIHEASHLKVDSALARSRLGWRARWDLVQGLQATVEWYRALRAGADMRAFTLGQIEAFQAPAGVRVADGASSPAGEVADGAPGPAARA